MNLLKILKKANDKGIKREIEKQITELNLQIKYLENKKEVFWDCLEDFANFEVVQKWKRVDYEREGYCLVIERDDIYNSYYDYIRIYKIKKEDKQVGLFLKEKLQSLENKIRKLNAEKSELE